MQGTLPQPEINKKRGKRGKRDKRSPNPNYAGEHQNTPSTCRANIYINIINF